MSFFSKYSIGIDIADHTIEVVELVKIGGSVKLVSLGRSELEPGIVENGRIKDAEKLSKILKQTLITAKPKAIKAKDIVFGLPTSQVYTHTFFIVDEKISKDELERTVMAEAVSNIPIKKDDLLISHQVLFRDKQQIEILLVATSKQVVIEWKDFFANLKIDIEFFDIESLAVFRDLFDKKLKEPVCIVDIGSLTTGICIFDNTGLRYSFSIDVAGHSFTQSISKDLKKTEKGQAEKKKFKISIANAKDRKEFSSLVSSLEEISREIKESIEYFQSELGAKVSEIILVGGSSQLKGLVEFFSEQLGLKVSLGTSNLLQSSVPRVYIEAVGLCLRKLREKKYRSDPRFDVKASNKNDKSLDTNIKPKNVQPYGKILLLTVLLIIAFSVIFVLFR